MGTIPRALADWRSRGRYSRCYPSLGTALMLIATAGIVAGLSSGSLGHKSRIRILPFASFRLAAVPAPNGSAAENGIATETVSRCGLSPARNWVTDPWRRDVLFSVGVESMLHESRSEFQHIQVFQTASMGRLLVLDGALQCAEADEAGYHEMIAHVPLLRCNTPEGKKRVLIIGGGDGGAAREVLRHEDVERVDLVDIDGEVMRVAKEYLPSVWRHPSSTREKYVPLDADHRLRVLPLDGLAFVEQGGEQEYDVIIIDASDPVGPGAALYSPSFYSAVRRKLRSRGAVAVQGSSFWYLPTCFRTVYHGLKSVFPVVKPYQCFTAIYPGGLWNLQIATLGDDPACANTATAMIAGLEFYSSKVHEAAFAIPPCALRLLSLPAPTISDASQEVDGIMSFGEARAGAQSSSSSTIWEPDVLDALSRVLFSPPPVSKSDALQNAPAPLLVVDADGTLWEKDAGEEFLDYYCELNGDSFKMRYASLLQEGKDKEAYTLLAQIFEGMPLKEVFWKTQDCFDRRVRSSMIPTTCNVVSEALSKGWTVKIVTASPAWAVEPGALALGLKREDVLGIRVEVTNDEKATSVILGPIPLRKGKVTAIETAMLSSLPTIAIGNNVDDIPMLGMARGMALVVNPTTDELAQLAKESGWFIHRYSSSKAPEP